MVFTTNRVAVIGAGVSGLASAKHLKAAGLEVVVYERSPVSGGIWTYIEQKPREPEYPSLKPSVADFVASRNDNAYGVKNGVTNNPTEEIGLDHGPPGPAYDSLKNNVPISLQELKGYPWKEGLEEYVNIRVIGDYLHGFSEAFGIEPEIKFDTRVEQLDKSTGQTKWHITSSTLVRDGLDRGKKIRQTDEFDAVVIANGHYHACRVPDIPGLGDLKAAWPSRVEHSKSYRVPDGFKDQSVLLIGSGVSSVDIARDITPFAKKVYQSSREGLYSLPVSMLPPSTERVADIALFTVPTSLEASSGSVVLVDGRVLTGIDRVIVCTGYHITVPFLPTLHDDSLSPVQADESILVTDGTQIHNLHKDIFYIPDPTLAFVGIPFYTATFTLFEIQAIAVSKVFSGQAWVPSEAEMRKEYNEKLETKGHGRSFHSLMGFELPYVADLVEWVNSQVPATSGEKMEGHTEKFLRGYTTQQEKTREFKEKAIAAQARLKIERQEAAKRKGEDHERLTQEPVKPELIPANDLRANPLLIQA